MASELFGIPNGLRAYQDDQIRLSELALRQQQGDSAARLADAQIANFKIDNDRQAAELQLRQSQAADAKRLQESLARIARGESPDGSTQTSAPVLGGGSKFDSLISTGQRQVEFLLATGNTAEAAKLLTPLTNGAKDLAQARQAASAAAENEYDVVAKRHEGVAKVLSGVSDQATYAAARMQLQSSGILSAEDLADMPARYDPRFVRAALAGTAAAKQKADLAREASRTATQNANDRDLMAHRKLARDLAERTHDLAVQREARLEKQGGQRLSAGGADKPLPPASVRELDNVRAELKRLGIKGSGDAHNDLVADIAEQVKILVDSNPGLSRSEAAARIVAEMRERGELQETMFGGNRYKPKEGSVTMPLPTPKTAAELKRGHYYLDSGDGLVKLFDGKGFKVATRRKRTDVVEEE